MTIWTDHTLLPIDDNAPYTDADGVQHLGQRDKASIPGLVPVSTTPRPDETPAGYTLAGEARGGVTVEVVDGREWRIEVINDIPTQVWNAVPRPQMTEVEASERAWATLRIERDRRLAASDIMVMPDRWDIYTPETKAAWTAYRQNLRDLPDSTENPNNVSWPLIPLVM